MSYGAIKTSADKPSDSEASGLLAPNQDDDGSPASSSTHDPNTTALTSQQEYSGNGVWGGLKALYSRNIGLFFVFLAQMFGSIMTMTTRLLETGFETKFHALQIIFVRMLATALIGSMYMWYKQVPDFPLGPRGVRRLLAVRGVAGSAGLFGLYYSLSYLDISDATVITFLVPTLTAFISWVALREPFTVKEAAAGLIAFTGVLFVARPAFLFPHSQNPLPASSSLESIGSHFDTEGGILPPVKATPAERAVAISCSIFGSFAAATAYATIRVIGKRAHSLVSVNYFAVLATVSSFLIIMIHPDLRFKIPQSAAEWTLLLSIGVSGFLLQVLLTEGLQREKAGRATNLIYIQMVFALIIERIVWGTTPPPASILGSALIIGAAVWVSLQKKAPVEPTALVDEERRPLNPTDDNGRS
ncbi:hypothetical protein FZEAL_3080 [Fusarium zealandicum]|uniref:EamA domain-containing protein n=1 Tax=Fusarium zealandicum TaxID=1053134 RepID=A0A8H4XN94_9HYPO|nr:hypothetical protein FZEAL_3080 [Fusarium zealandicum]